MPEFIPNTTVRLLNNVPLFSDNKNQLTFANVSDQESFFIQKTFRTYDNLTYQRKTSYLHIPENADHLINVNYMMYRNSDFGTKWFYAFVTNIEYVNDSSSIITFELDAYQTFQFDIQILNSFVEREHVADDTVGLHTVPENLETGPYIATSEGHFTAGALNVYIMVTESLEQPYWKEPGIVGGFPVPVYWASLGNVGDFTSAALKEIIDTYAREGKSNAIVAVFTAPENLVSTTTEVRVNNWSMAPRRLSITPKKQ